MFTEAIARAGKFTIPVVISSRTVAGKCRCEIGAGVVVNPDGWVLTAAHVLALIRSQQGAVQAFRARPVAAPGAAPNPARKAGWLARRRSRKRSAQQEAPHPDVVRDHSVWWGTDGATLNDVTLDAANDLAVGRLQPFDPRQISYYPVFKRPDADYRPGRSLCRLGFSFHDIVPTYDEARQAFLLPADSVPLPLFPFEGMLVRILRCPSPTAENGELGTFIETSTPGLRGQSGGPIFDVNGAIWALQSHTRHYPLDFKPRPHQFLNVGVGAHAEAILRLLDRLGLEYRLGR